LILARPSHARFSALLALTLAVGCSSNLAAPPPALAPARARPATVGAYIKHVVVIVQENRTFENIFAGFPGADAPMYGYLKNGRKIPLRTVHFSPFVNLNHDFGPAVTSWNAGKMNGFDGSLSGLPPTYPYAHLDRSEVAPYWSMAGQYVLADHMFPTEFGPSFTSHLNLIAGTTALSRSRAIANNPVGGPWGCDATRTTFTFIVDTARKISPGGFPCYTQFRTMADTLDARGVSWKYYAPPMNDKGWVLWSTFDAIKSVRYSADWKANMVYPQTRVLADAKKGTLPGVSWVIPDWEWSDHTSVGNDLGPSWVAAVVNAIGKGPDWKSTAIVVVWDDWGGWYDNVAPPKLDYRGPGIRVGCLIVSPYARPHYVSHTVYEFGSILHFIEDAFDLPPLGPASDGYTDARAASLADSFDFTQAPLKFAPIHAKYPPSRYLDQKPSMRPPDTDL
jgi:phospholipase C